MTQAEFENFISEVIERKLLEFLVDPDKGQLLQSHVQEQLTQQRRQTTQGERGQSLQEVVVQLG
jgi:hypothetical protein